MIIKCFFLHHLNKYRKDVIFNEMNKVLNNEYYLLRHGKNIHQTEKKDIVYGYPDDNPPCALIEEGVLEARRAGEFLKDKSIDYIFSSDALRTRQTSEEVSRIIEYDPNKIIYDLRLRDNNWGIFNGRSKKEVWDYYENERIKAFSIPPPHGESWHDCQNRIIDFFEEIESGYSGRTILIVSHSNPLWLLEGALKGLSDQQMLDGYGDIIKTGEIRKI